MSHNRVRCCLLRIAAISVRSSANALYPSAVILVSHAFRNLPQLLSHHHHHLWRRYDADCHDRIVTSIKRGCDFTGGALVYPHPQIHRNAAVTCEIKLFQNHDFSLRRRLSEIILLRRAETCLKLFRNYSRGLLHLVNIFATCLMSLK